MPEIFISYAREDRPRVEPLALCLERQGWSVFWDRKIHAGEQWHDVISKALDEADRVVVVWSSYSLGSDFVRDEAAAAQARRILLPILLDGVQPPLGFRQIQAADFSDWHGAESAPELEQLLRDLGTPRARHGSSIPSATLVATPHTAPKSLGLPKFAVWAASGGLLAAILALVVGNPFGTGRPALGATSVRTAAPSAVVSPAVVSPAVVSPAVVSPAVVSPAVVSPAVVESEPAAEQRQLLKTLRAYLRDLNAGEFDAQRYFSDKVSLYIAMKNPSTAALNQYFEGFFPAHYRNFRVEMFEHTIVRKAPRVFTFREVSHFNEVAKQNRRRDVVAEDRVTLDDAGKILRFEQSYISG
jgi:hypothetical protein